MVKKRVGNPAIMMKCKLCRFKGNKTEMRLHEPGCRREKLLKPGAKFHVRLNCAIVPVSIKELHADGTIDAVNLSTGRTIKLKSFRRFREWMGKANVRFTGRGQ